MEQSTDSVNDDRFRPPDDRLFQDMLRRAVLGEIPVYGVVIDIEKVPVRRRFQDHRPENSEDGEQIIRSMWNGWNSGKRTQPWLYVWDDEYTVADDYFWIALIERGKPKTVAAQVLGEPLETGLVQKVGPLEVDDIKRMLGFANAS